MSLFSSAKGNLLSDGDGQIVLTKLTKKSLLENEKLGQPVPPVSLSLSIPNDRSHNISACSSDSSSPLISTSCVDGFSSHLERQFPLSSKYVERDKDQEAIQLTSIQRIYPPPSHHVTSSPNCNTFQQIESVSPSKETACLSYQSPAPLLSSHHSDTVLRQHPINNDDKAIHYTDVEQKSRSSSGASSTSSSLFNEEVPEEGTLEEILCAMPFRNIICPILLYTYRTFTTMDKLIDTMDKVMVETIHHSSDIDPATRDKFITAFKSFLIEWLSPPHVEDFNQPPDFPGLYRVSNCVRQWSSFLSASSSPSTRLEFPANDFSLSISSQYPFSVDVWDEVFRRLESAFNTYLIENKEFIEKAVDPEDDSTNDDKNFEMYSKRKVSRLLTLVPHETSDPGHLELFDAKLIAAQLTIIDKEIFSTLVPHHCLYRVRYHRWPSSPNLHDAHNRLSKVVEFTIRQANSSASSSGEMVLYKWILVAKELRALKNYNSLTSIAQTLRKLRDEFPTLFKRVEKLHSKAAPVLQEVEKLSEPSGNYEYVRFLQREATDCGMINDLYFTEGSGKVGHTKKTTSSLSRLALGLVGREFNDSTSSSNSRMYGAVPFLAPYLYDLTLALNARSDFTKDGRINFRKKLQEFYILCTIYCLQSSTKYYEDLKRDDKFLEWYTNLELDLNNHDGSGDDVNSIGSVYGSSGYQHSRRASTSQSSSSVSIAPVGVLEKSGESAFSSGISHSSTASYNPEPLIMRIQLVESGFPDKEFDSICYKSIVVTPNDMMPMVVRKCLEKFGKDAKEHSQYQLIQKLPNKREIILPDTQNAYYAIAKDTPESIHCELRLKPLDNKSPNSLKIDHNIRKHLRNVSSVSMQ